MTPDQYLRLQAGDLIRDPTGIYYMVDKAFESESKNGAIEVSPLCTAKRTIGNVEILNWSIINAERANFPLHLDVLDHPDDEP